MRSRVHLIAFWGIHVASLLALYTGVSTTDVLLLLGTYWIRMFAITAGYHRYLAHRAYKTSRPMQFLLALVGTTAVQKGPLWWAAVHRAHHRYSDKPKDVHSPLQRGFWYAHVGWIVSPRYEAVTYDDVPDLAKYPELRWLDRHFEVPPALLALGCYAIGGLSGLVWGFAISTVLVWHATFCINSLAHRWGSRRYRTGDESRNNVWLALLTLGEGWHNNHHRYCTSANQGFFWWEIDISYGVLRLMGALGLVSKLRKPPARLLAREAWDGQMPPKAKPAPGRPPAMESRWGNAPEG